jgi:tetratricopeptide (TPR) repeat protein
MPTPTPITRRRRRRRFNIFQILIPLILLAGILYFIPPIRERVDGHLYTLRLQVIALIRPPEKEVFVPQTHITPAATPVVVQSPTVVPTTSPTAAPTAADQVVPTGSPVPAATALPAMVSLKGVKYMDQHGVRNYCAPSTLGMALSYWGWKGVRADVGKVVKPYDDDYNVMPYELVDYAVNNANLKAITRVGGTVDQLKSLVAGGFPVMLETGIYELDLSNVVSWMGHYILVTGYDDANSEFILQDAYNGPDHRMKYDKLEGEWRAFNFLYLIVYSPEKEGQLMALMGSQWDENTATRAAYDRANLELGKLTDMDQYYAWFNRGTAMVKLQDYAGAAQAYDQAFTIYQTLPEDTRPYRMVWYQTGPYQAYYFTGRYQDLVNLADFTLGLARHPGLEESNYWRAMGYVAIGKRNEAIADLHLTLQIHPNFDPSVQELKVLGVN